MTAGHCITEIEKARRKGYDAKFSLRDDLGPQKRFKQGIPFLIDKGDYAYIDIDHSDDYAAIHLHDNTRRLMEANGIRALDATVWKLQPREVESFGLVGIPDELLERVKGAIGTTTKFYFVEPFAERPEAFKPTDTPRFYGRIVLGENETNIEGVSGGPIFSFARGDDGQWRYWLYAVQSSWIRDGESGLIAACPVKPFIENFESALLQAIKSLQETKKPKARRKKARPSRKK
jgi:hypothetical protein